MILLRRDRPIVAGGGRIWEVDHPEADADYPQGGLWVGGEDHVQTNRLRQRHPLHVPAAPRCRETWQRKSPAPKNKSETITQCKIRWFGAGGDNCAGIDLDSEENEYDAYVFYQLLEEQTSHIHALVEDVKVTQELSKVISRLWRDSGIQV